MRLFRELRLIPVVAIAAAALFVLKTSALLIEGGYTLIASRTAQAQGIGSGPAAVVLPPPAPLEDTASQPAPRGDRAREAGSATPVTTQSWVRDIYAPGEDITGSVAKAEPPKEPAKEPTKDGAAAPGAADKNAPPPAPLDVVRPQITAGERAVLESLQQRRQELEARARELEVRDNLLKAAEKRIEQRLQELKEMETRLTGATAKKDDVESAKFKSLVSMYENMKAKDAAKVFDRLDLRVLLEIANAMNPRRMSDILGQMTPEAAERLTIEIANRSGQIDRAPAPAELPKIEGRPNRT